MEQCLTENHTILDVVLSNLIGKDLASASCVCWFWYASAQRIWHKRHFILSKLQEDLDCNERSMNDMGEKLSYYIANSKIYPSATIMFVSRSEEYMSKSFTKHIRKVTKNVSNSLPTSCKLFGALGGGIIGTDSSRTFEVEQHEGLSTLLIPRSSEVSIHNFFVKISDIRSAAGSVKRLKEVFHCSEESSVKLILLHACTEGSEIDKAIKIIVQAFGADIVIAGGLAQRLIHDGKLHEKGISGLVFAGELSANLIVHKTRRNQDGFLGKDKEKFFESLQTLKLSSLEQRSNVIFMYSCVARGYGLYNEHNVQTKWISEVFPGIPVVGMFAFGEIGYSASFTEKKSSGFHSYSTVLCLCQF